MDKKQQIATSEYVEELIGPIQDIEPIFHQRATTGNVFKVSTSKKVFKISVYDTPEQARQITVRAKHVQELIPRLHYTHNNMLIFEWIYGNSLKQPLTNQQISQIGMLYGQIHQKNHTKQDPQTTTKLQRTITRYKQAINEDKQLRSCIATQKMLAPNTFVRLNTRTLILEFNDANLANFIEDIKQRIWFVDEEAINYNLQGRGLYGLLNEANNKQKTAFWKGYQQHQSKDWYTSKYEEELEMFNAMIKYTHRKQKYGSKHQKTRQTKQEILTMPITK